MQHLKMTDMKFDVGEMRAQLAEHPEIWNEIDHRTRRYPNSPHREIDDIWVRYNPLANFDGDWTKFNGPHEAEWYPVTEKIPEAQALAVELAVALRATRLGAVLITRVPAGKQVYPHIDSGWHARYYEKFVIQVESNLEQAFCFEEGILKAAPGDCYWFDNAYPHWVINPSKRDRISLIVCVRRDKCH